MKNEKITPFQYGIYMGQVECVRMMKNHPHFNTKIIGFDCEALSGLIFNELEKKNISEFFPTFQCLLEQNVQLRNISGKLFTIHTGKESITERERDVSDFCELMGTLGFSVNITQNSIEDDLVVIEIVESEKPKTKSKKKQ